MNIKILVLLLLLPSVLFCQSRFSQYESSAPQPKKKREISLDFLITTKNLGIYLSSEHFFKNRFSVGPFLSFQEIKNTTFNFYRLGGHLNLYLIKGKTISIYLGGSAGGAALSVGSSLEKARLLETFSKYMSVSGKNNPRQANLVRIQYNKDLAKAESYNEYIFSESFLAYVGLRFVFNSKIKGTMVFGNEDFLRLGINYSL